MLRSWGTMRDVSIEPVSERSRQWAATMSGFANGDVEVTLAHHDSHALVGVGETVEPEPRGARARREAQLDSWWAPGATRGVGAGRRERAEEPDALRTCFERDRDRILHSSAFRRLGGKTQVFIFPDDHMRTRLTHALEVAQVATGIARPTGLNEALTEAIALGHDCGHGPGGHASEEALDPFVDGGFDHAVWGAEVSLASLNLCAETLDGIANHSWARPAPSTPEGEVVSWADRIAYVCHDFEDAVSAGLVEPADLPAIVRERCGARRGQQLGSFIHAVISTVHERGVVGMSAYYAEALTAFRTFNYEVIYLRDASRQQGAAVVTMLRELVEYYRVRPELIPDVARRTNVDPSDASALHDAVAYVAGMTDRYACQRALTDLRWTTDRLPQGIDR